MEELIDTVGQTNDKRTKNVWGNDKRTKNGGGANDTVGQMISDRHGRANGKRTKNGRPIFLNDGSHDGSNPETSVQCNFSLVGSKSTGTYGLKTDLQLNDDACRIPENNGRNSIRVSTGPREEAST